MAGGGSWLENIDSFKWGFTISRMLTTEGTTDDNDTDDDYDTVYRCTYISMGRNDSMNSNAYHDLARNTTLLL